MQSTVYHIKHFVVLDLKVQVLIKISEHDIENIETIQIRSKQISLNNWIKRWRTIPIKKITVSCSREREREREREGEREEGRGEGGRERERERELIYLYSTGHRQRQNETRLLPHQTRLLLECKRRRGL